jgi:hypothetical protein
MAAVAFPPGAGNAGGVAIAGTKKRAKSETKVKQPITFSDTADNL